MKNNNISIIISAYKASEFIEECLDSIINQTYFLKNNIKYEILLGIDGCEETLNKVKEIKHKYKNLIVFNMNKNMGVYITLNTLIDYTSYDYIIRFDADDIMMYDMIEKIISENDQNYDIIRFKSYSFKESINKIKPSGYAHGVCFFNRIVFNIGGGFKDWICAADTEFFERTKGYIKIKNLKEYLFYRRLHKNNLTIKKDTGHNSQIRNKYIKNIKKTYNLDEVFLDKVINNNFYIL